MANDRLIRETKVYRKYFHGKCLLVKTKSVLVNKNGILKIEKENEEFITGR